MKLSLEEVSEYLEQVHVYSGYAMSICPFHDDHSPSMMVWGNGFKCKSCNTGGSLEYLYSKVSGRIVKKEKAYNRGATIWREWEEKFGSIPNIARIANVNLLRDSALWEYMALRKLEGQIKYGMFGYLDGFFTFPISNEYGDIVGMIARASTTIQSKHLRYTVSYNCPEKLYVPSWRNVHKSDSIYVCYGTMDVWSLHIGGYAGVTGISGQELNAVNLDRFRKPMYIIPDRGEENSALELMSKLGWRGMILDIKYPDGCKDLNDIHVKYGLDTMSKLIETAKEKYNYETT